MLWLGILWIVGPFLNVDPVSVAHRTDGQRYWLPSLGVNALSIGRALILFNLVIGVQTLLNLSLLTGGAPLPLA